MVTIEELIDSFPEKLNTRIEDYREAVAYHNDKPRKIQIPNDWLMAIQKLIPDILYSEFQIDDCVHSMPGKSIITNAAAHEGADHLLKVDIKQYYQTIKPQYIFFHLAKNPVMVERLIKKFCFITIPTYGNYLLPTGSPSSPAIANIVGIPIDKHCGIIAKTYGYTYTRYMDDLIFSSLIPGHRNPLLEDIKQVIEKFDFKVHPEKTRWLDASDSTIKFNVTGINLSRPGTTHKVPLSVRRIIRSRIFKLKHGFVEKMDDITLGYLSYVKAIEPELYKQYMESLNGPANCIGTSIK
jgi:RNA-directed DNA polymerase